MITGEQKQVIITDLIVPQTVKEGEDVKLTCKFKLLGLNHRLYTVNWWRGKDQFFSYKRMDFKKKNAYPFQGITVDVSETI